MFLLYGSPGGHLNFTLSWQTAIKMHMENYSFRSCFILKAKFLHLTNKDKLIGDTLEKEYPPFYNPIREHLMMFSSTSLKFVLDRFVIKS